MSRFLGMLALSLALPALLPAPLPVHGAPIPRSDGPNADQKEVYEAIDEIQLSVASLCSSLITADANRAADAKGFVKGQETRTKSLLSLVRIVEKQNALLKGDEKTATVLKSTLKATADKLEKAAAGIKAAGGKDDWAELLQKQGRELMEAKLFNDLAKHRGIPMPSIVEIRED